MANGLFVSDRLQNKYASVRINKYADPQAFVNALKTKDLLGKFFTSPND